MRAPAEPGSRSGPTSMPVPCLRLGGPTRLPTTASVCRPWGMRRVRREMDGREERAVEDAARSGAEPEQALDADADVVEGNAPPSERRPLDRTRIVATAVAYIDENGLAGLSMRRLGGLL